jgi:hypothetical protein
MILRMNDDDYTKQQLEEDFIKLVEAGEDFRFYLYFSPDMLSSKVKDYLDAFLLDEAYTFIESGEATWSNFVVYNDPVMTIKLDTWEKKTEIIEKMLKHFEKKEEYEKCKLIQEFYLILEAYQF